MRVEKRIPLALIVMSAVLMLAGCQTDSKQQVLAVTKSQVELRSFQTRAFDTTDKEKTLTHRYGDVAGS